MRTLPIIAAACLLLPSCQTINGDGNIANTLASSCQALETGHLAFAALTLSGDIRQSTIDKEAAAYAGVQVICADPSSITAGNALVRVATAYATIAIALKEAKAHD